MAKSVAKKTNRSLLLTLIFFWSVTVSCYANQAKQWQAAEFSFTAEKSYEYPVWRVDFGAVFKGPNNLLYKGRVAQIDFWAAI